MEQTMIMPIGVSDFKEIRQKEYYYVDKTSFIKDIIDDKIKILLLTRPRRFGKTINMSMLRYYFEKTLESNEYLFKGLSIDSAGEKYKKMQGRYPVIFFTLKDIKCYTWEETYDHLKALIADEFNRHMELVNSTELTNIEKKKFIDICTEVAKKNRFETSLAMLTQYLAKHYKVAPILFIDEYDVPIGSGFTHGFYHEIISFMRNWLSAGLKDNSHLEFAILTGILRVAKESIFSGFNNPKICTILDQTYCKYFGFTSEELRQITIDFQKEEKLAELKKWYNGYNFGELEIYNPWSVINYFSNHCLPQAYWLNTSSNDVIKELLLRADNEDKEDLRALLEDNQIESFIDTNIVYDDIYKNKSNLYSFLLQTGYLKTISHVTIFGKNKYTLAIPNEEIKLIYRDEILNQFCDNISLKFMSDLLFYLLNGKIEKFTSLFQELLLKTLSFYDHEESFYHGFLLGMTALLTDQYIIKSNRESGLGRFDLAILPRNQENNSSGIIMEFKFATEVKDLKGKAIEALSQIDEKMYDIDIKDLGIKKIYKYGIAFCGKLFELKWHA